MHSQLAGRCFVRDTAQHATSISGISRYFADITAGETPYLLAMTCHITDSPDTGRARCPYPHFDSRRLQDAERATAQRAAFFSALTSIRPLLPAAYTYLLFCTIEGMSFRNY